LTLERTRCPWWIWALKISHGTTLQLHRFDEGFLHHKSLALEAGTIDYVHAKKAKLPLVIKNDSAFFETRKSLINTT